MTQFQLRRYSIAGLMVMGLMFTGFDNAQAFWGKCLLVVGGVTYINGPCKLNMESDGSFGFDDGRLKTKCISYDIGPKNCSMANTKAITRGTFGLLSTENGRYGHMDWNEGSALHGHARIKNLTRSGACWLNPSKTVQLCAWRTSGSVSVRTNPKDNKFAGWCVPSNGCMEGPEPVRRNKYMACEGACTFTKPVSVTGLDATLYYRVCEFDGASSSKDRVFALRYVGEDGAAKMLLVDKNGAINLERCK